MNKKLLLLLLAVAPCFVHAEHSVNVYGYVKLDVEYYDKNMGSFPSAPPIFTPLSNDKANQHSELIIDARESRVGVETKHEINDIKIAAAVEGDFFTIEGLALTDNGRHFKLRLAYAKADLPSNFSIMAGQFWSLLMNSSLAQPFLVDFNGPVGALFAREPQLRVGYTKELCNCWGTLLFEADIEKNSTSDHGYDEPAIFRSTAQGSDQRLPLFVGKVTWTRKPFAFELGGSGTQIVVPSNDHGGQLKRGVWGAQFTAEWKALCDLVLYGSVRYLDGLSRLGNGDWIDAVVTDFGRLVPVHSIGWYAGFNYTLCERTSINGVYGWERASQIAHSTFTGEEKGMYQSIHLNILHDFWDHWKAGLEYQRFETKTFNGIHGHVNMLHFGLWYFF